LVVNGQSRIQFGSATVGPIDLVIGSALVCFCGFFIEPAVGAVGIVGNFHIRRRASNSKERWHIPQGLAKGYDIVLS
jgi:hypothetical protein